jgi:hypothetical protein
LIDRSIRSLIIIPSCFCYTVLLAIASMLHALSGLALP